MSSARKTNKNHKYAVFALIIVALVWGAAGPIIKYTLTDLPIFTFLFLRFLVASIIILPFLILEEQKNPILKKDMPSLVFISLLGGPVYFLCIFFGFKYTSSLVGTLIGSSSPLVILFASAHILREKITYHEKLGAAIAIFGTAVIALAPLIVTSSTANKNNLEILGNLFMLMSIGAFTLYTVWSKRILDKDVPKRDVIMHFLHIKPATKKYSPLVLTALMSIISLIAFAPLAYVETLSTGIHITAKGWFGIVYMGVFSTLLAYGLYEWAIKYMPVAESTIFSYLGPIFAIPVAYILLGETVDIWFIIAAAIITVGVYISELPEKK